MIFIVYFFKTYHKQYYLGAGMILEISKQKKT